MLNMFVGVVVENFHRCREEQEKEERVRRAAKRAKQMEKKRRSRLCVFLSVRSAKFCSRSTLPSVLTQHNTTYYRLSSTVLAASLWLCKSTDRQ